MRILLGLLLLLTSTHLWSYANFIGHGYQSCMGCHYNPMGGGQLTDYGRSVSATLISSRAFYSKNTSEEKISYMSGFLFRKPKQDWLRLQANYRGFLLVENPGSTNSEQKHWIPMEQDLRATGKFGENDRLIFVADVGKSPKRLDAVPGVGTDLWRSRNHYVGYRVNKKWGVYAGSMDKAYGLRIIEHIAFSRQVPQVGMNDQTHGVMAHYVDENWEGAIHGYVGNLFQDSDLRMRGASTQFEKTIAGIHRVGASFKHENNSYSKQTSYAVHGRLNIKEGSALLAELGQNQKSTENGIDSATARYGLLQTSVRPVRGVYLLANVDYLKSDIRQTDHTVRWGPALQYFPIQRIELRADIYDTRNYSSSTASKDSWMYLLQTHLWL